MDTPTPSPASQRGELPRLASLPLILASASPRRKELLTLLGRPFEVIPSDYEEVLPEAHPHPEELAAHLATAKALEVAERYPEAVVIGADTIVALNMKIYGKPADRVDVVRMLEELSGRTHQVITAVTVTFPREGQRWMHSLAATTDVTFRRLELAEMEAYAATDEPHDKAGAYAIQGYGGLFIEGIQGDYPNVVGLPVMPLAMLLRNLGIPILGVPSGE